MIFFPNRKGIDIGKFIAMHSTSDKGVVILRVVARDKAARAMRSYKVGDYITGKGQLSLYKNRYTILVTDIPENCKPKKEEFSLNE